MDVILIRALFVLIVAAICFVLRPFNLPSNLDAVVGLLIGVAIIIFEWRLRVMSLKRLIGAAIGSVLGIFGAYLFALVIRNSIPAGPTQSFLQIIVMLLMAYVGLIVGANKGDLLNLAALGGIFGGEKPGKRATRFWTPASSSTAASPISPKPDFSTVDCHPAICLARVATGRRLGRFAEAQPRPARSRYPAAPAEDRHASNSDRRG